MQYAMYIKDEANEIERMAFLDSSPGGRQLFGQRRQAACPRQQAGKPCLCKISR